MTPKVRLREHFKRHRIGDTGYVTTISDLDFPPVTVDIKDTPDYNGVYYFHYHDLEIVPQPPVAHSFITLPDKFCVRKNDLKRFVEGPATENPEICRSMCSKTPGT